MFDLRSKIKALDIQEDYMDILHDLIYAETIGIFRFYNPTYTISKEQVENSTRIWVEIKLIIDGSKELSLFQCRPFIDKGAKLIIEDNKLCFTKSYYLYK